MVGIKVLNGLLAPCNFQSDLKKKRASDRPFFICIFLYGLGMKNGTFRYFGYLWGCLAFVFLIFSAPSAHALGEAGSVWYPDMTCEGQPPNYPQSFSKEWRFPQYDANGQMVSRTCCVVDYRNGGAGEVFACYGSQIVISACVRLDTKTQYGCRKVCNTLI
jgi:hypothetical protein